MTEPTLMGTVTVEISLASIPSTVVQLTKGIREAVSGSS